MSEERVTLTIDGIVLQVDPGTNLVDAAHEAGIEIPIFCHHPYLEPVGMCRMCLVEVGLPAVDPATGAAEQGPDGAPVVRFGPKLVAGCTALACEGMVVRTGTPAVSAQRRAVLEFLLTSHPLDCPVCDKGGECPLQNLTMRYGPGTSRFVWAEKYRFPKPVPIGPLVVLDRERCVLCARCVRFQEELAGDPVLGFESRARGMEIVSYSDPPFRSVFSGNTTDICPVGALTTVDFRFQARPWEVVAVPGVCVHCAVGCNLAYDIRHGRVERVMPRRNDEVNEIWLCDKGRFGHHFASAPDRLRSPLVRREGRLVEATWDEALAAVADGLAAVRNAHGAAAVGGIAGDHLPNEDLYVFGRFLRAVVGTNNVDHLPGLCRDDTVLRAGVGAGTRWADVGSGTTVLVVGLDVEEEAPLLFLHLHRARRRGARLVVLSGRPSKLDGLAAAVLRYRYGEEEAVAATLVAAALPGGREVPARRADGGALSAAVAAIGEARDLMVLFGHEAQRAGLVPALAALVAGTGHVGRPNNGLVAVGRHANAQGAADMGVLPDWLPGTVPFTDQEGCRRLAAAWPGPVPTARGLEAAAMLAGGVRALMVAGTDPVGAGSAVADTLMGLDLLVVQELFLTATARQAHVVLPALSAPERDGTFTNCMRRVQRFSAAVRPDGLGRPDWQILRDVAVRMGVSEPYASAGDVLQEITRLVPGYSGLAPAALGAVPPDQPQDIVLPFAPLTAARDVEYLGTAYENRFGAGWVWPVAEGGDTHRGPPPAPPAVMADLTPEPATPPADAMLLVPVPLLYDRGTMLEASLVLRPLVPRPYVAVCPSDAQRLGLVHGTAVCVRAPGGSARALLRVVEGVPPGCALAPDGLAWTTPVVTLVQGRRYAPVSIEAAGA